LQHFPASRKIAQAALWSAAHCRSNDVTGAAVDALSILRLGRSISQTLDMGCLADVMLQRLVSSFVAQNIGMFHGADAQRIAEAFQDPLYEEAPSRAIEQEAELSARYAAKLSVMPPDEAEKETARLVIPIEGEAPGLDRDNVLAALKQINDSQRQLAKALASSSEDEYTTWFHDWTELMHSNPLAPALLGASDLFVEKVRGAKVGRALTVAGLAVAEGAPVTLYTDPSSGQPFIYTKTADGFQLQSAYKFNGKPMTMQFK
ncbi:MAG TPA: hypothetical protein VMV72_04620, partial [Verrucomicrobiae bacterium]|nr:hypothetical protein [Verrucomicrobiae bacterium]